MNESRRCCRLFVTRFLTFIRFNKEMKLNARKIVVGTLANETPHNDKKQNHANLITN